MSIQVSQEGSDLVIRLPIQNPLKVSKSGKSYVVATTEGNHATSFLVDGKPVVVGVNAYIPKS